MNHKVIGISQSFSPAPFVRALKERLQSTFLPDGSRPRIELVDLDWSSPDADAPKLVQEGDVKIRVLEESYQLIEKGAQVIALCNFRNISFLNEVQTEITTPVTDILQACIEELKKNPVKKLGYLGRPDTDKAKLITETVSREVPVEWVYPSEAMLEVFDELESGSHCAVIPDQKKACELFGKVCSNLLSEGAELVFPTCVMQALFAAALKSEGYNVLDSMSAYVSYLCFTDWENFLNPSRSVLSAVSDRLPLSTFTTKLLRQLLLRMTRNTSKLPSNRIPRFLTVPNTYFTAAWIPHFLCMPLAASSRKMRLTQS